MPLDLPYEIINDEPANATPVQADFARIEQHINQEVIDRSGTVAMTGQLRLVGNPVAALDAAPKQYVDTIIPIGGILTFGGVAAPPGGVWLLCDGSPYETAVYPALFAVIGTRFGGSGGFFNVPPLVNRMPIGGGDKVAVGAQGGSADAVVIAHDHDVGHTHPANNTNQVDLNHLHPETDHLHSAGGLSVPAHNHGPGQGPAFVTYSPGGSNQFLQFGGAGNLEFATPGATDNNLGSAVTGQTGAADRPLTTGWMDRSNLHGHTTPALTHAGRSGPTGVVGTDLNMPPYVGVTFLIRAA